MAVAIKIATATHFTLNQQFNWHDPVVVAVVVSVVVVAKKTEKCKHDLITHSDYGRVGNKEKQIDR